MKALKGLLIYIGIVLAIIIGLAIILFAVMYFVPSFRIMGVGVIHGSEVDKGSPIVLSEYSGYSDIEININSKKIDIKLDTVKESNDISYVFNKDVFGIAFDITEYKVLKDISVQDGLLKINFNITEPSGFISTNNSLFSLVLPATNSYNIISKTESGDIVIGEKSKDFQINNLTITTDTGNFELQNAKESSDEITSLNLNSLNLTTSKGRFNFSNINNLTVNNVIKLNANDGTFEFNDVNGSFDITGKGIKIDANDIVTNSNGFKFISENGFFEINKINTPIGAENTIVTENCDIKINEIFGRTGIITTYGNITIGQLNDSSILQSEHGNVTVTKAKDDIRVSTDFGNITIKSYEMNGIFISRKGNINVKSTGDYVQGVYTQIENVDGQVTVDNKINRLLVVTTGSSKSTITFREIKGGLTDPLDVFQHKINIGGQGSAVVYMPTVNYNTPFKFIAKGNISGEISGLVPEYEGDKVQSSDDFQYFPTASETTKEECQKSCYFEFIGTINFKGYLNV